MSLTDQEEKPPYWDDCNRVREYHEWYIPDGKKDIARCKKCKKVAFRQTWWADADTGCKLESVPFD